MSSKIPVPSGEKRLEFFASKGYDTLQKYQFYDNKGEKLRFVDTDRLKDGSHTYLLKYEDEKDKDKESVEYTDDDPLYYGFKDKTEVPPGKKRRAFLTDSGNLQYYQFYDKEGTKLRFADAGTGKDGTNTYWFNVVDPVEYDDNAPLYYKEIKDIDEKLVEYRPTDTTSAEKKPSLKRTISSTEIKDIDKNLVEYRTTDTTTAEKKPSFKNTISTIGRSIIRRITARKSPKKGGKNRRSSNNKQKTRKTRKQ